MPAVCRPRTSGFAVRSLPAGCNCVLITGGLTFMPASRRAGTAIGASNDPIVPLAFSRTTTLTENRPGGSVTPD